LNARKVVIVIVKYQSHVVNVNDTNRVTLCDIQFFLILVTLLSALKIAKQK